jgi:hypothetical protein
MWYTIYQPAGSALKIANHPNSRLHPGHRLLLNYESETYQI